MQYFLEEYHDSMDMEPADSEARLAWMPVSMADYSQWPRGGNDLGVMWHVRKTKYYSAVQ
jgi:hypothetical protein